jgi:hypothetical protein
MKTFDEFREALTESQKEQIIRHFHEIYDCNELTQHEFKIAYLAYLWKNGQVINNQGVNLEIINAQALGVDLHRDYEISFEGGDEMNSGGVNLDITYDYYSFDKFFDLV